MAHRGDTDDMRLAATVALRLAEVPTRSARKCQQRPMPTDSTDVVIAKRLLDHLKFCGFQFQRVAPGEDGPLVGQRVSGDFLDLIHIEGFSIGCFAWRKRISSLIVPGEGLVERRTHGHVLTVLNEVLTWSDPPE